MANVKGIKEKVHFPLYDAVTIKGQPLTREGFFAQPPDPKFTLGHQLALKSGILRFFVDVQNKTKLETNMQASSVLPHFNTMEVRSLRVTVNGGYVAKMFDGGTAVVDASSAVTFQPGFAPVPDFARVMDEIIHGSVLSLTVGEKIMIQHPTYYFPAGGGLYAVPGSEGFADPKPNYAFAVPSNGVPAVSSTFRFAESVFIEKQQNFKVEIEFPETAVIDFLRDVFGPVRLWVSLDGFLTRDVQ
jgi:hypothetical protein